MGVKGMRPEGIAILKSFTVTLTEKQCEYLEAMFRERLESHQIREKNRYPQDEEGGRFAMELWRAFRNTSSQHGQDRGENGNVMLKKSGIESRQPVEHGNPDGLQRPEIGYAPPGLNDQ